MGTTVSHCNRNDNVDNIENEIKENAVMPKFSDYSDIHSVLYDKLDLVKIKQWQPDKLETVYFYLSCYSLEFSIHGVCTLLIYPTYVLAACNLLPWYLKETIENIIFLKTSPVIYLPKSRLTVCIPNELHSMLNNFKLYGRPKKDFICTNEIVMQKVNKDGISTTKGKIRLHRNLKHIISLDPFGLSSYLVENISNILQLSNEPDKYYLPKLKILFDLKPKESNNQFYTAKKYIYDKIKEKISCESTVNSILDDQNAIYNELKIDSNLKKNNLCIEDLPTTSSIMPEYINNLESNSSNMDSPSSTSSSLETPKSLGYPSMTVPVFNVCGANEIEFWLQDENLTYIETTAVCTYTAYVKQCLSVTKDDHIQLLSRISSGWSMCRKSGKIGWIPTAVVPQPSVLEIKNYKVTIRPVVITQRDHIGKNENELTLYKGEPVVFMTPMNSDYIRVRIFGSPFFEGEVASSSFFVKQFKIKHVKKYNTPKSYKSNCEYMWIKKNHYN